MKSDYSTRMEPETPETDPVRDLRTSELGGEGLQAGQDEARATHAFF